MKKTNYHTHCTFCDGKNSIEEMTLSAIEKGFDILGFSSHAMLPLSDDWHIAINNYPLYVKEIQKLKEKFHDKIELYTGFEADYIQKKTLPSIKTYAPYKPDYIIASVHFVPSEKGYFEADGDLLETRKNIKEYFGGDVKKAVCEYFENERRMLNEGDFSVIGHCDLIRIQNGTEEMQKKGLGPLFSENESWYRNEIKETARQIAKSGVIAEVNTGGLARKRIDDSYPSLEFLELLHEYNVPLTLNSDSHSTDSLDFAFEESLEKIKKAGYKELSFFSTGSWKFQKID